jgi:hypothetical protein
MEETFFAPCTRMHDLIRAWNVDRLPGDDDFIFPDFDFEEVELRAGAGNGAVDFLDLVDLWDLACRKFVWMGPDIWLSGVSANQIDETIAEASDYFFYDQHLLSVGLDNDSGENIGENTLHVCFRCVTSTNACNHVFQLITWNNTIWTHLGITAVPSISTDYLSRFLKNSRSSGGTIHFVDNCLSKLSQDQLRDYLEVFVDSAGPLHQIRLTTGRKKWLQFQIETIAEFLQRCSMCFCFLFSSYSNSSFSHP